MWRHLAQGVLIAEKIFILIIYMAIITCGYRLTAGDDLCIGSTDAAKGMYSSYSKDGYWSEINKYRAEVVTCYRIMNK